MARIRETRPTSAAGRHAEVGPLRLDCLTLDAVMQRIEAAIAGDVPPLHVVTANAQFLRLARENSVFAQVLREAGLVVPDGMPLVWLGRLRDGVSGTRITGHDLVHASAHLAAREGLSVGFLGAGPGVAEKASEVLTERHPGLRVAGIFGGNFTLEGQGLTSQDEAGVPAAIREAKPDILFVALGCPKQEMWIHRHQRAAGVPVAIGIGGVLDVLAGRFKRAPRWAQRSGVEWAYRLAQDPGRLWKRYLAEDLPALTATAWESLRHRATSGRTMS